MAKSIFSAAVPSRGPRVMMTQSCLLAVTLAFALHAGGSAAIAQSPLRDGYYKSGDGGMTVKVTNEVENGVPIIQVVDPVATARYKKVGGEWEFTSRHGTHFQVKILSGTSFLATKRGLTYNYPAEKRKNTFTLSEAIGSRLDAGDGGKDGPHWATFEKYKDRIKSDPANTHVWAACGAAALARSLLNDSEANAYAVKVAASLKPIMVRPNENPCPEAIPAKEWMAGGL